MKIRVLLFGPQAAIHGATSIDLEVGAKEPTPTEVLSALSQFAPELADSIRTSRLAVNHEFAPKDLVVHSEDEVALIGMVSGRMSDQVIIKLVEGPLLPAGAGFDAGVGASLVFEGIVRPIEQGEPIVGLIYEAYEPMTGRELTRLAEATLQTHGLICLKVEHSIGRVAAGEVSFRLTLHSAHRNESLQAADEFIDQMKQGVPLWKTPIKA